MKRILLLLIISIFVILGIRAFSTKETYSVSTKDERLWNVQAIDTMKYSRDMARAKIYSPSFDVVIDHEMQLIADAGATHVAIGTPYDEEFIPILTRWVASARAHHLSVWFRGNFSGWEGWFDYPLIDRATHLTKLNAFITTHPDLFQDGDIFSPCPECENGPNHDPRATSDVKGFNDFLSAEYTAALQAFHGINTSVTVFSSMNGDIASDIITPDTAQALGGTILIDHYVASPVVYSQDIKRIGDKVHAHIGIGEVGAPVPDLNGAMTQSEQADFINKLFGALYDNADRVSVVNYWNVQGGSTAIVSDSGTPRLAYDVVKSYFKAPSVSGTVLDSLGSRIPGAEITIASSTYSVTTAEDGSYKVFLPPGYTTGTVTKVGYAPVVISFVDDLATTTNRVVVVDPTNPSWWYTFKKWIQNVISYTVR